MDGPQSPAKSAVGKDNDWRVLRIAGLDQAAKENENCISPHTKQEPFHPTK